MSLRKLNSMVLMVIMILLSGCQEEPLSEIDTPEPGIGKTFSLVISMPGENTLKAGYTNTRIALEQNEMDIKLSWEEGDIINLCFVQGDNSYREVTTVNNITNQGRTAEFSFDLPEQIEDGIFDLYGVYGGKGLSTDDPAIALLPDNSGNGSLTTIEESEDMMLYFASEGVAVDNPKITVDLMHLGSFFSITLLNSGETAITGLDRVDLASDASNAGWAYNNEDGGGSFDLVDGVFLNTGTAGSHISFNAGKSSIESGEALEFWGWYPILPGVEWPDLKIEMKDNSGSSLAVSTDSKLGRETEPGKAYYLSAEWDGTKLSFTQPEVSNIYFVKNDGSDANDGKSWNTAFKTIAVAISTAADGDEIRVATGVYNEVDISFSKEISLKGGYNIATNQQDYSEAGKSTIDGGNAGRIFDIRQSTGNNNSRDIDNFKFIDGEKNGSGGAIIQQNTHTTVTNCVFENNENINSIGEGGAIVIHASGSMTLVNCLFKDNTTVSHGGAIAVWANCTANIINCTFTGNTTTRMPPYSSSGAVYVKGTSESNAATANIYNSIFWNNYAESGVGHELGANYSTNTFGKFNLSNNIIKGGEDGIAKGGPVTMLNSSEIDAAGIDPQFVSASDTRLSSGSPAINTGNNALVPEYITIDIDGNPRFNGIVDLGPYENQ